MTSRARMAEASGPYRSTVPPKIADWAPDVAADLAADTEEAAAALSRFDDYARAVLGESSPSLGPMSSILLRTESTSSSQIEDLTVGARQLALAEIDQSTSDNARTVVANVRAMEAALDLADSLDTAAVLEMHRALLSGQRGWEEHAGQWRDQLVWIGTSSVSPRGASHVAPQAALVPGAMDGPDGLRPQGRSSCRRSGCRGARAVREHPPVLGRERQDGACARARDVARQAARDEHDSTGIGRSAEGHRSVLPGALGLPRRECAADRRAVLRRFAVRRDRGGAT